MELTSSSGEKATLISWTPPHKPSSTGRVYVDEGGFKAEYYPGVYGGKFTEPVDEAKANISANMINDLIKKDRSFDTIKAKEVLTALMHNADYSLLRGRGFTQKQIDNADSILNPNENSNTDEYTPDITFEKSAKEDLMELFRIGPNTLDNNFKWKTTVKGNYEDNQVLETTGTITKEFANKRYGEDPNTELIEKDINEQSYEGGPGQNYVKYRATVENTDDGLKFNIETTKGTDI